MNIFHKIALQGLIKNRTRTLVTIAGVVLSTALITAVATFGLSLLRYMTEGAIASYGSWHAGFYGVDEAFVQAQRRDGAVASVAACQEIGYAALRGGQNPDKPYLFVLGMDEAAMDTMAIDLLSGRLPQTDREVLVPAHVAANGGVKLVPGDTITLSLGYRVDAGAALGQHNALRPGDETLVPLFTRTYTVVGICQRPRFEERSAPGYTLITRPDTALASCTFSAYVTLNNPRALPSYTARTAQQHAYVHNDNVLRYMGLSSDRMFTSLLYAAGGILLALILLGSVFLIYNAFSISMSDRMHQFGVLMSVGATQRQLRGAVLFEGLCIGAIGIPLGLLTGFPSIALVLSLVRENFGNVLYDSVPLVPVLSVPVLAGAAALSLATLLLSAYWPAKKAASTPVMACIRQTGEIKVSPKDLKTSPLALRLYGLEGTLALKNFRRNRRRYRSIVLSLTLSVVLFVATRSFSESLGQIASQANVVTDFDIVLTAESMADDELIHLYDKVKTAAGVTRSGYQAYAECPLSVPADALSQAYWAWKGPRSGNTTEELIVSFQFLDDASIRRIAGELGLPAGEFSGDGGKLLALAKMQVSDAPIESVHDLDDLFTFPETDLSFPAGDGAHPAFTRRVSFQTFMPPDTPLVDSVSPDAYAFYLLIPYSQKDRFAFVDSVSLAQTKGITFLSDTPAQSTAQIESILSGESVTCATSIQNVRKLLEENRNILFIVKLFSGVFIAMISLIAVANVFNTISTNIKLRRRELAMLRSVGMADRDFGRMMRFECALYGTRTLLWGVPLSILFSMLIWFGLDMGAGELRYVFPLTSLILSMLGVFLVIFVTMLYATSAIRKDNIIDALRDEMT